MIVEVLPRRRSTAFNVLVADRVTELKGKVMSQRYSHIVYKHVPPPCVNFPGFDPSFPMWLVPPLILAFPASVHTNSFHLWHSKTGEAVRTVTPENASALTYCAPLTIRLHKVIDEEGEEEGYEVEDPELPYFEDEPLVYSGECFGM